MDQLMEYQGIKLLIGFGLYNYTGESVRGEIQFNKQNKGSKYYVNFLLISLEYKI